MTYVVSVLIVVGLIQVWMLWRLARAMRRLASLDEGLARCTQGLSLLVDTSEAGFSMLGSEICRLAATPQGRPSAKSTTRRIVTAARRGRAVPEIAAREGLSEGEVRLRMHLADAVPGSSPARSGGSRGSVRA